MPRTFYDQAFQDATLYYFDPSARILVPEIVHVPQGQQFTTSLVHALLLGPPPSLVGVARTFVPPGLTVGPVVVTNGVADVALRGPDPGSAEPPHDAADADPAGLDPASGPDGQDVQR